MTSLFQGVHGRGGAAAEVTGEAWVRAMLDVEAALARACERAGVTDIEVAEAVVAACHRLAVDVGALSDAAAAGGNPVIPLVALIRDAVGVEQAAAVHFGATSQDVLDTAMVLVVRRALVPLLADASASADAAAALAARHRDTPVLARTLQQPALATTFGLKAATWASGIDAAAGDLRRRGDALPLSLGGPAGTLGGFQGHGPAVSAALAEELGVPVPMLPWHADRTRVAALGAALAVLGGALAKVAGDVILLAQAEIGEVTTGSAGGSSSMAHKRNPVPAIAVRACAQRLPGLAATLLAAMPGEHERAAGAWHAEWEVISDALRVGGSAAAWSRELLEGLQVDAPRMRENLERAAATAGFDAADLGEAAALVDAFVAAR